MRIEANLNQETADIYNQIADELDLSEGQNEGSAVINYALINLAAIEKIIQRTTGITDPADFIELVNEGMIIIVKK